MKKLLTILVLIMLIISFFQITSMYALYKERIQGEYSSLLGAWIIKVNETEVTTKGQNQSFTIPDEQINYVESDYVQAGKIAPGSKAYVDIAIDPSDTDVSIVYTINVGSPENATIQLIEASNYFKKDEIEGEETEELENDVDQTQGNTYTSIIPFNLISQGYKNYVRLYFKWVNVEDNNESDSALAETEGATLSLPVEINLKQYTGEVIVNEGE